MVQLAALTRDLPGTGGRIRVTPEDFRVEEIPLYPLSGEGEFVYFQILKRKLSTFEVARRVARALGMHENQVSYAGLKDARAVTTQWLCVQDVPEQAVRELDVGARIGEVRRHGNRLKIGHLRGNRFRVVVREACEDAREHAAAILEQLVTRGVPNYFGAQRFGVRLTSHRCGEAMLRKDYPAFLDHLLGGPSPREFDEDLCRARELYDRGRHGEAFEAMPIRYRAEKKALGALLRFKDPERAFFAVPKRMRRMFGSSYQSSLFNGLLEERVDRIDRLEPGDLAYLHRNGAVFEVTDPETEQPRCRSLEISPSGPMYGTRTDLAGGAPGERERAVLAATGLQPEDFDTGTGVSLKGSRRPLRVPLKEVALEPGPDASSYVVRFVLPSGSFATSVLAELLKA